MLVGDILAINATNNPTRTALVAGDHTISFAMLHASAVRLGNALRSLGKQGDRVAILATNVPDFAVALYGAPGAGMILTLLNYRLTAQEWAWIINDTGASIVIIERRFLDMFRTVLSVIRSVEHVIVIGGEFGEGEMSFEQLVDRAPKQTTPVTVSADDVAYLVYTSGTTGFPKGAMLTHGNVCAAAKAFCLEHRMDFGERYLQSFPLCHISAFQVFAYHMRGAEIILPQSFSPESWFELVKTHRVTQAVIATTMAALLVQHAGWPGADLSSLRSVSFGGMALPLDLARIWAERVPEMTSGFGQTEATLMVTHLGPSEHKRALNGEAELLRSCGRANALSSVRIVDDEMRDCPDGLIGELCVRGPQVMRGYWNNEEATDTALRGGWLHTGDLATRDKGGLIYLVGREKDMVKTGGQNVYPRELEQILVTHPAVAEVAVLGLPDPVWGETVTAAIVLKPETTVSPEELIDLCIGRLASYKKPKLIFFVPELPKNVSGKVMKRELREMLQHRA